MADNLHEGHRKRLKEEFVAQDFHESIPPHRILEMLLFYGIPRKDTNPIAHELLNKFGSLRGVIEAPYEDLFEVKGMTQNAAALIKIVMPIARRYETDGKENLNRRFNSIDEIGEFLTKKHMGYGIETFAVTCFKPKGELIACEIISKGDMTSVPLTMKSIVQTVLKHKTTSVVISHNHINKDARPSIADLRMTKSIKDTLASIGVNLLDHIIVSENDFISLAQSENFKSLFIIK
jgi:DNA repair protein RadC